MIKPTPPRISLLGYILAATLTAAVLVAVSPFLIIGLIVHLFNRKI